MYTYHIMLLYRRRREKLQAHLKESRSQKNYNLNSSSLVLKPSLRPQSGLQLQKVKNSSLTPVLNMLCIWRVTECT